MSAPALDPRPVMELRFPARADQMLLVRALLRNAAMGCGLAESDAEEIVLAICEACQNIIRHGYQSAEPGDIVVALSMGEEGIDVRVTDFAPTIDPARIRPRPLSDVRPGGLGVHFINELMDSTEFLPGPDGVGNVLRMTRKKRLSA